MLDLQNPVPVRNDRDIFFAENVADKKIIATFAVY